MPRRPFTNRRELEEHSFHPAVLLAVPLCALFLNAYLPRIWQPLSILDLPLIIVLYFSIAWRNPIAGTLFGTVIGLLQDLPGNQFIGVNGIAKSVLGYAAASIGLKVDVENMVTRVAMNFVFCLLQSALLYLIQSILLGQAEAHPRWIHELIRAAINSAVAIPIFLLLDRTRMDTVL
ncbi:rod shape-determining protein MreD [Terriglobus roseus]|uniref:Rod shape-determining protein MreD n=1 Tax=Terriglobus roseus TaxID=392734 RepID=A0A1G7FJK0_9BACT|nr:rod shape-determining protein MreD [Terriglobus roseus]SDE76086.1 rod shape-determining protein MreD [Terriglobus roseus]